MFLASISSSFLTFQFVRSDTANLRTLKVSRASIWIALRVVYDIAAWFVQANAPSSEFRSSSYDCSFNSLLWSSLLYTRCCRVYSPSSVTVGSSLSLTSRLSVADSRE